MARLTFNTIFTEHADGTVEPKQPVRIGGVTLSPGVKLSRGVFFGGIDIVQYKGRDLEIIYDDGTAVIIGIY